MNENISHTYNIALKEFRSILGDSLLEIDDLRASYLIEKKLPYRPTQQQLEDIRNGTRCNFIINYEILVLNNQTGSFAAPPPIGNTRRINEATVEILIFDLKTLELISQSSVTGRAKVDISQDESGGNIVETPSVIARKALSKLIEQYDRNQIK